MADTDSHRDILPRRQHKVGKPRFDPVEKLRHRLYEALTLLWMLSPATGVTSVLPELEETQYGDFFFMWRRFLDNLSFFCDWESGGKTVSSVAAQSLSNGHCYWLASASKKSFHHFEFVMDLLEAVSSRSPTERRQDTDQLVQASIELSKPKIKHYRKALADSADKVEPADTTEEGLL